MDDTSYIGRASVPSPPGVREPLPEPPPTPPRSRPLVWVLVIVSVAVILLATGVLFGWAMHTTPGPAPAAVASPPVVAKKPSPKRSTPQAVTQKYLDALAAGDAATGDAQVCGLLRGKTPSDLNLPFTLSELVTFEAGEGTVTGKTASVPATVSMPVLGSTNFKVFLIDEQGAWKVCGVGPA